MWKGLRIFWLSNHRCWCSRCPSGPGTTLPAATPLNLFRGRLHHLPGHTRSRNTLHGWRLILAWTMSHHIPGRLSSWAGPRPSRSTLRLGLLWGQSNLLLYSRHLKIWWSGSPRAWYNSPSMRRHVTAPCFLTSVMHGVQRVWSLVRVCGGLRVSSEVFRQTHCTVLHAVVRGSGCYINFSPRRLRSFLIFIF